MLPRLSRLVPPSAILFRVAVGFAFGFSADPFAAQAASVDLGKLPPAILRRVDFLKDVHPILASSCYSCHGEEKQKAGLRLDLKAEALKGGEKGRVIIPGKSADSPLIHNVAGLVADKIMPPRTGGGNRLNAEQIGLLRAWIDQGAVWPESTNVDTKAKKKLDHWAFKPVANTAVPRLKDKARQRNAVDAFVLAKLEANKLKPSPLASKRELIRRAYYDLTGLPPTPQEVEAFVADKSPRAWEQLIDRLLDSPRYGEKWGRHWLDLVRFAESNSYELDDDKPHAWRFRDYVIRAFNADKPYDRFLREQLAGDELPNADTDALIATGFYRLGIWDNDPPDRELARFDNLDDIVATTGQVFLGLTVDCARCHNHKIDPIAQKDYYRLLSFFANVNPYRNGGPTDEVPLFKSADDRSIYEQRVRDLDRKRGEIQTAIDATEQLFSASLAREESPANQTDKLTKRDFNKLIKEEGRRVLGAERFARYLEFKEELQRLKPDSLLAEKALAVTEAGSKAPDTFLLARGNPNLKTDLVEPGFIEVLNPPKLLLPTPAPDAKTSGRRTALANWIASPTNPLTARVMVNRIWQYHFGRGLVRSPSNFGTQGDRPTHPELLDWLASEFTARGWSMKAMHRLIMTSEAYRRSSHANAAALKADPANDLFWRFDMRRLTAEEIRDSILVVTGALNLKMFGPGIFVDIPKEVLAGQSRPGNGWGKSSPEEQARRSIYIKVKRSLITPILESFDVAETDRTAPVRFATVQPTQALGMINGSFLNQQAEVFAARLRKEAGDDVKQQVQLGLSLATARPPTSAEVQRGVSLINTLRAQDNATPEVALKYFCLMVLNLNELVYVD